MISENSEIRRIRVHLDTYFGKSYVCGIEFFDKDNLLILSAGLITNTYKEAMLEIGERLVGVRSTLYSSDSRNGTIHCDLTLVVGKLE